MCGIMGAIGDYNVDAFKMLLLLNKRRGGDATGVYNSKDIVKEAIDSEKFLRKYNDVFSSKTPFIMGHTRLGTHGSKTKDENAHPFKVGTIVGTHNGIITNTWDLKKHYDIEFEVDSQYIFHALTVGGIDELRELYGYYAIAWFDLKKPSIFNLIKHDAQLSILKLDNAIYYTSDNDDFETVFGSKVKSEIVPADTLLSINVNTLSCVGSEIKGLNPRNKYPVTNYKPSRTSNTYYSEGYMDGCDDDCSFHNYYNSHNNNNSSGIGDSSKGYYDSQHIWHWFYFAKPTKETEKEIKASDNDTCTGKYWIDGVQDAIIEDDDADVNQPMPEPTEEEQRLTKETSDNLSNECTVCSNPRNLKEVAFVTTDQVFGTVYMCESCWKKFVVAGYSLYSILFPDPDETNVISMQRFQNKTKVKELH